MRKKGKDLKACKESNERCAHREHRDMYKTMYETMTSGMPYRASRKPMHKMQNCEWTHSFQIYRRAEQLCHFLFRNMSGSVFIPESTMLRIIAAMCDVLTAHEMPYRTPELLQMARTDEDGARDSSELQIGSDGISESESTAEARTAGKYARSGRAEMNRIHRFCKRHADRPADSELYELYRAAEVFTAAFDCGKLLCCDDDQHLPWSTPLVMELMQIAVAKLQAEGYPAEIPSSLIDDR